MHSRFVEELREVTLAPAGKGALAFLVRVELEHGLPERRQRRLLPCVIPDARRDHAARTCHASHFGEPLNGIRHEVHDELRQRCVEHAVGERQRFRRRLLDVDTGMALARSCDEGLRRIDGRDVRRAYALHEFRGERAGTTADVEHSLSRADTGKVCELRRQEDRVPPHEAVIRISGHGEAHGDALPRLAPGLSRYRTHPEGHVQAAAVVTTSANSSWRLMPVMRAISVAGTTSPSGAAMSNVWVASRTNHTS